MVDRVVSTDLGMLSPYQGYSRHLGGAHHRVAAALRSSNSTRSPLSGCFFAIDLLQLIILCAFLWLLYGCQVWLIRPIMSIDAGRTDRDKPCISPERLALQTEQVGLA